MQKITDKCANIPKWLCKKLFMDILKQKFDCDKIENLNIYPALSPGENYATVMLRVETEMSFQNLTNSSRSITFMFKISHDRGVLNTLLKEHNLFEIENVVYFEILPEFQKLYRNCDVMVNFGPQTYKLKTSENYVLLEDLCSRGLRNVKRHEGLDMQHTKSVLHKLAQFHAASAVYVETKEQFSPMFTVGVFTDTVRAEAKTLHNGFVNSFLEIVKQYLGNEYYWGNLEEFIPHQFELLYQITKIDPNDFNVLNHGDCWINNFMFQYDSEERIKETYFIDFQIPKYGSPAQDLFTLILSSVNYNLKVKYFDYFIKYYHENLFENLKLLGYPKTIPTLRDLHIALHKYGLWGLNTVTGVMASVLVDPCENATYENFHSDTPEGRDFRNKLFSNPRYRKHVQMLLPWLYNRGVMTYF